jgi:CheY-like chemotaxis protein
VTAVLLAEDDDAIAAPLSRALGREGYSVTVEQFGPSVLDRALEGGHDLLILDLGLGQLWAERSVPTTAGALRPSNIGVLVVLRAPFRLRSDAKVVDVDVDRCI